MQVTMYMNKAEKIWRRAVREINPESLKSYRRELGIHDDGLKNTLSYEGWYKQQRKLLSSSKESEHVEGFVLHTLFNISREIIRKNQYLTDHFGTAVRQLIVVGNVDHFDFDSINATGCEVLWCGKNTFLEPGVYIRVGELSSLLDIKDFVTREGYIIDILQKNHYGSASGRVREEKYNRNYFVYLLSLRSKSELLKKAISMGCGDYVEMANKNDLICRIVRVAGYDIAADNCRQIIARERKKRKIL